MIICFCKEPPSLIGISECNLNRECQIIQKRLKYQLKVRQHLSYDPNEPVNTLYFSLFIEERTVEEYQILYGSEPGDIVVLMLASEVVNCCLDRLWVQLMLAVYSQSLILQEHDMKLPYPILFMIDWYDMTDVLKCKIYHFWFNALRKILGILAWKIRRVVHSQVWNEFASKCSIWGYFICSLDNWSGLFESLNHFIGRFSDLDSRTQMN